MIAQQRFMGMRVEIHLSGEVREQRQRVNGMERREPAHRPARLGEGAAPRVGEDALREVLAQPRIGQPAFLPGGRAEGIR